MDLKTKNRIKNATMLIIVAVGIVLLVLVEKIPYFQFILESVFLSLLALCGLLIALVGTAFIVLYFGAVMIEEVFRIKIKFLH